MSSSEALSWEMVVNDMVATYGRQLVFSRTTDSAYEPSADLTPQENDPTTNTVIGAIVPASSYMLTLAAANNQVIADKQCYIGCKDITGSMFIPQINDVITSDRDYKVSRVNEIEVNGIYVGFILDIGA